MRNGRGQQLHLTTAKDRREEALDGHWDVNPAKMEVQPSSTINIHQTASNYGNFMEFSFLRYGNKANQWMGFWQNRSRVHHGSKSPKTTRVSRAGFPLNQFWGRIFMYLLNSWYYPLVICYIAIENGP